MRASPKPTVDYRMSLDETLDCGEDTDTPALEDDKIPSGSPARSQKRPSSSGSSGRMTDEQEIARTALASRAPGARRNEGYPSCLGATYGPLGRGADRPTPACVYPHGVPEARSSPWRVRTVTAEPENPAAAPEGRGRCVSGNGNRDAGWTRTTS